MRLPCGFVLAAFLGTVCAGTGRADGPVVLRTHDGRFLRPGSDGTLQPGRRFPAEPETLQLFSDDHGRIALAHERGPVVPFGTAGARGLRVLVGDSSWPQLANSPRQAGTPRAWLTLVPLEGNRVALREGDRGGLLRFTPAPQGPPIPKGSPDAGQSVEILRVAQIPEATRQMLARLIQSLVTSELDGKVHDKRRRRKREEYVTLPAPTIRDPRRTKRHRVLSTHEETHVRAQLDGKPEIEITHMPYLSGYKQPGEGSVLIVVRAVVPILGRVGYKVPGVLDVATNFRARVRLSVVAEIAARGDREAVVIQPPAVLDVEIRFLALDVSNDLLQSARKTIRDLLNEELERKEPRICQQANKAIRKAVDAQEFRLPLLRYLAAPEAQNKGPEATQRRPASDPA